MGRQADPRPERAPIEWGVRAADFNYELPQELIAQRPLSSRSASRMLVIERRTGVWTDSRFRDLPRLLGGDDCLAVNNSRVLAARLLGRRVRSGVPGGQGRDPAARTRQFRAGAVEGAGPAGPEASSRRTHRRRGGADPRLWRRRPTESASSSFRAWTRKASSNSWPGAGTFHCRRTSDARTSWRTGSATRRSSHGKGDRWRLPRRDSTSTPASSTRFEEAVRLSPKSRCTWGWEHSARFPRHGLKTTGCMPSDS